MRSSPATTPPCATNSAGKPIVVGEVWVKANEDGVGCVRSFAGRARIMASKLKAYLADDANAGVFAWVWEPGNRASDCEISNFDLDQPTQEQFRVITK